MGRRIGPYEVAGFLGVGGMGMVYRAADKRLGRGVALRFLPKGLNEDAAALERFRREAKIASKLNHPNICTIYDIGEDDGAPYLVMELLEGRSLRDRMAAKPLDPVETVDIALQITDALEYAHREGVVHRDIKPANIFLTKPGPVKVLDFGLSKLSQERRGDSISVTVPGARMGAVGYMAPELAMGGQADARADLFSFGVVLYEMCTGRLPFSGPTPMATLDAILHAAPTPADRVNPKLAPELARVIEKALDKDPALRYQSAAELRVDLKRVRRKSESGGNTVSRVSTATAVGAAPRKQVRGSWFWPVVVGVSGALVGGGLWFGTELLDSMGAAGGPPVQSAVFSQITDHSGEEFYPSLAPDGKSFVFAGKMGGKWDIYLQRVTGAKPLNLTRESGAGDTEPAFSPDGDSIVFRSERDGGGIFLMGATGEAVRKIASKGFNPAWSPDGKEIVYATQNTLRPEAISGAPGELWRVSANGGESRLYLGGDSWQPSWSPHGHRIAYWTREKATMHLWTASATSADPSKTLVRATSGQSVNWGPVWAPDGHYLYFSSDRGGAMNLWRIRIDEKTGVTRGEAEAITTPSHYSGQLSFGKDPRRFAYVNHIVSVHLYQFEFDPVAGKVLGPPAVITRGARKERFPDLSPDGSTFVYRGETGKQEDIFLATVTGEPIRQLTDDSYPDRVPRWSPDGSMIAFYSLRGGADYEVYTIRPDGSGLTQRTRAGENAPHVYPVWSPSGKRIAVSIASGSPVIIDSSRTADEQNPEKLPPLEAAKHWFAVSAWSPDEKTLLGYESISVGGSYGLMTDSFETKSYEKLSSDSAYHPVIVPGGRSLIYTSGHFIKLYEFGSRKSREIANTEPYALGGKVTLSKDGRKIYLSLASTEADIWLVDMGKPK